MVTVWIIALTTFITAVGIFVVWGQLKVLSNQFQDDHLRSRHEMAINLLIDWVGKLERETSAARKLAEELTLVQAGLLFKEQELELKDQESIQALVDICLAESKFKSEKKNGKIFLDVPAVSLIRWQVISYLNYLETMLSAWRNNVATRSILEEEFNYLFDEAKGFKALSNFRKAAGGDSAFPAITEFEEVMVHKKLRPPGLPQTGQLNAGFLKRFFK